MLSNKLIFDDTEGIDIFLYKSAATTERTQHVEKKLQIKYVKRRFCLFTSRIHKTKMELDSELIQKKLYFVNQNLVSQHSKLSFDVQARIPLENLSLMGILIFYLLLVLFNSALVFRLMEIW